jgi:restriction system protein
MGIPDFQSAMLPLLKSISDGNIHEVKTIKQKLAAEFNLTELELIKMLPSGRAKLFDNRLGWANFYLKKAGLIVSNERGKFQITDEGKKFLAKKPDKIKVSTLKQFRTFQEFQIDKKVSSTEDIEQKSENETISPEEKMDEGYTQYSNEIMGEILKKIIGCSPSFFESLVVDLLINMGYGGSRKDAGEAIGRSGDGGIDGLIKEDKLGLDTIYIQAKKYDKSSIPISDVRDFAGSLLSKKAKKGIFITTSDFPDSAHEFVKSIEPKIVLINGSQLVAYMYQYNIGVSTKSVYEIKNIDHDYFEEITT